MVMVVGETSMELDQCFQMNMEGVSLKEWKDIPVELLMRILPVTPLLMIGMSLLLLVFALAGEMPSLLVSLVSVSLVFFFCFVKCNNNMNSLVLSLAPKFVKLQTLILRHDKPQLEDNAVEAIAIHCHELQELDLSKSLRLTDRSLYSLAHGCPNLTKLNLSGCTSFSDKAIAYLTSPVRLVAAGFGVSSGGSVNEDKCVQAIGNNCNQMQSLNLGRCEKISDDGVLSLAYGCPDLRTLDLCGCVLITGLYYCRNITDRAMYPLAQSGLRRAEESQHQPMHCAYTFGGSSGFRYVSCSSHVFRKTFACDERVFELNVCALCLYPSVLIAWFLSAH
ncbi:hypothetical protein HID58_056038 [Brassica napus]|uniref:Uncharacterized protein n=1 Tax=Brassica napus TaxID=3708 RepID=A0ABQ8AM22_BRANA|nr:hypothetical protein HID58_056038 [Brassica napus]